MPGCGLRLTRPTHPALTVCRPAQVQRRRARTAGAEPLLCRVALRLPSLQPQITTGSRAAETAGAGGLKIAETFPAGRGSPHGCGLRAVFFRDAASARPEACRDKSKAPRSGDVAGRSPGVQGAAATGRPLCAPCGIRDITQKTYRERHRPEITQNNRFSGAKPLQTDNRIKLSSPDGQSARASGRSGSVPVAMPDGA